jgi:hypothetical protein
MKVPPQKLLHPLWSHPLFQAFITLSMDILLYPIKIYAIYLIRMSIVVICSPVKFLTKQIVQPKRRMRSSSLCEASRNLQMSLPRFTKTLTLLTFVLWSNLFYDIWSEEVCKLLQ